MSKYLFIESRDPFESVRTREQIALGAELKRQGHDVALFLVQNGVLPLRAGARSEALHEAMHAGLDVLADEFSMHERGISARDALPGVKPVSLADVVRRLVDGWKVLFL